MAGDVHARLGHDLHGAGVEGVRGGAGGIRLDLAALEAPRPALGHLAAAGVAGAKKEHAALLVAGGLVWPMPFGDRLLDAVHEDLKRGLLRTLFFCLGLLFGTGYAPGDLSA